MADKNYSVDDIIGEISGSGTRGSPDGSVDDIINSYSAEKNFEDSGLGEFFDKGDEDISFTAISVARKKDYPSPEELKKKAANITAVPDEELSEEDRVKKSKQIDYEILSGDYERKYVPEELKTSIEIEAERREKQEEQIRRSLEEEIATAPAKKQKKGRKAKKKKDAPKKKFGLDLLDDSVSGVHSLYEDDDDFERKYGSMPLFTDEEKDELIGEEHIIPYDISDEEHGKASGHSFSEKMELSEYDRKYAGDERHKEPRKSAGAALEKFSSIDDVDKILAQYENKSRGNVREDSIPMAFSGIFNKLLAKEGDESGGELQAAKVKRIPTNAISRRQLSEIDVKLADKIIDESVTPKQREESEKIRDLKERRREKVREFKFVGAEEENTEEEKEEIRSKDEEIEDFNDITDIPSISAHIEGQRTKLIIRLMILAVLFGLSLYIGVANDYRLPVLDTVKFIDKIGDPEHFLFINSIIGVAAGICAYQTISNGLQKLASMKADCDSLCSMALCSSLLTSFICMGSMNMVRGSYAYIYTPVAIGSLIFNTIGKLLIIDRTKRSFKNISDPMPHYALFVEGDDGRVQNFTRGALTDIPTLAGMRRTELVSNFLRTSYSSDSTDTFCKKISPFIAGAGLVLGILATVLGHAEHGMLGAVCMGLSVFSAVTCICSCFGIMLVVNFPMNEASKAFDRNNGALVGFDSIAQFAGTNSVMVDAAQLFPAGSIRLINIKTFPDTTIDEAIIKAASLTHQSGSILDSMFYEIIGGKTEMLDPVENYLYEDSMGLCGWIGNKRVLLGNRELMVNHSIEGLPSPEKEEHYTQNGRIAVYLSISGQLSGMYIIELVPSYNVAKTLLKLEKARINIMLHCVDSMLTVDRLAEMFIIEPSTFHLVPFRYHRDFISSTDYVAKTDATLCGNGSFSSFVQMLVGVKSLKNIISAGTAMQAAQIFLGILIVLALVLTDSMVQLNMTKLLMINLAFTAVFCIFAVLAKKRG